MKRLFIFTKTLLVASLLGVGVNAWATSATGLTSNPMTLSEDVGHTTHYRLTGDATNYYELVATYDCTSSSSYNGFQSGSADSKVPGYNTETVKRYKASQTGISVTNMFSLLTLASSNSYQTYYYYTGLGMNAEYDFTVKVTSFNENVLVVKYLDGGDGSGNTGTYDAANAKYDYINTDGTLSCKNGKNSKDNVYLSFSVYKIHHDEVDLRATATMTGMTKSGDYYYPVYTISAYDYNTSESVENITCTATASDNYSITGTVFTYTATNASVTVTVTDDESNETTVEIPACSYQYIHAFSSDLTDEANVSPEALNGAITSSSTINGFTDASVTRKQLSGEGQKVRYYGIRVEAAYHYLYPGKGINFSSNTEMTYKDAVDNQIILITGIRGDGTDTYANGTTETKGAVGASISVETRSNKIIYTAFDVYAPTGTTVSIPLPNAYATYASTLTLDFTGADVRYIKDDAGTLKALAVEKAAAQTPLLITKTGEETSITATVVDMSETTTDTDGNLLVGQLSVNGNITLTSASAPENHTYYALGAVDDVPGFYKVGENNVTIAYGKAYLDLETAVSSPARANILFVGKEITGITDVIRYRKGEKDVYYNLSGQRISHPVKGLYIVNGKKVIIK